MQRFGRHISTIWPADSTSADVEATKLVQIAKWLEDLALEPTREVDCLPTARVEYELDAVPGDIAGFNYVRQRCHELFQRGNLFQGFQRLDLLPVCNQFRFVQTRPFSDQPACAHGTQLAGKKLATKIERRELSLILDVEMRGVMIVKEHPDDDAEKRRNDGHS